MSPNAKGRHCQSCEKTVVDFSIMTDADIISFFKNKPKNVCGRFSESQLSKQYTLVTPSQSMSYARAAALVAGLFVAGCQELPPQYAKENMEQVDCTKLRLPENMRAIFGTVKSETESLLMGAEIRSNENQLKVYSDMNGEFVMLIDKNIQTVKLHCIAYGFDAKILDVDLNKYNEVNDLSVMLTSDKIVKLVSVENDRKICSKQGEKENDFGVMVLGDIEAITTGKIGYEETAKIPIDFKLLKILNRQKLVDNLLKQMKSKPK